MKRLLYLFYPGYPASKLNLSELPQLDQDRLGNGSVDRSIRALKRLADEPNFIF